jgi:hypothetical protein
MAATTPGSVDPVMSPTNQRVAHVLRNVLGWSYLLVLLALALYASYRYWRWQEDRKRRFRNLRRQSPVDW